MTEVEVEEEAEEVGGSGSSSSCCSRSVVAGEREMIKERKKYKGAIK